MKNSVLYLKIEQSMDILNKRVYLQDIAKIMCNDKKAEHELKRRYEIYVFCYESY